MDTYYSSDEELAWGPLTIREIKSEFSRKPRKVKHRQSDFASYDCLKSDTSAASAYFTASETMQSGEDKNEKFLGKLSKVINGDINNSSNINSSYASALDNSPTSAKSPPREDTLLQIIHSTNNGASKYDLENIQQTLVDNTVAVHSDDDEMPDIIMLDSTIDEEEESEAEKSSSSALAYKLVNRSNSDCEDIILISDSSDSADESTNGSPINSNLLHVSNTSLKPPSIKKERKSRTPKRNSETQRINLSYQFTELSEDEQFYDSDAQEQKEEDISGTQINVSGINYLNTEKQAFNSTINSQEDEDNLSFNSQTSNCDNITEAKTGNRCINQEVGETEYRKFDESIDYNIISEVGNKTSESPHGVDQLIENTSNLNLNEESNESYSSEANRGESEELCFNDTLEEIEMALKQGLNYKMPDDAQEVIIEESPLPKNKSVLNEKNGITPVTPKFIQKPKVYKSSSKKFDYVQSPIGDYIKRKSPNPDIFKLPQRPIKSKLTPSPSVASTTKYYKSIVSPVGVYIKNAPGCLKENVKARSIPRSIPLLTRETPTKNEPKVDATLELPGVIYKPPKNTVALVENEIVLPSSIKKMVLEPIFVKHEKRVNANLNQTEVEEKLLKEDLTCDSSLLSLPNDVSFVTQTQAFIR